MRRGGASDWEIIEFLIEQNNDQKMSSEAIPFLIEMLQKSNENIRQKAFGQFWRNGDVGMDKRRSHGSPFAFGILLVGSTRQSRLVRATAMLSPKITENP